VVGKSRIVRLWLPLLVLAGLTGWAWLRGDALMTQLGVLMLTVALFRAFVWGKQ
jgi:hypothetical protein